MGRTPSDIEPRIVEAARARFLHEGVDGASLRAIARDAGTSIGMVYYYFPTKNDLFLAVVEEVYAKLLHDLETELASGTSVDDRLRRLSARIGAATDDELKVIRLVICEALISSDRLDRVVARFQRGHLPLVVSALADGVEAGAIDASIPLPVLMMCALGLGVVPQIVRRIGGKYPHFAGLPESGELARALMTVLFHGIGPKNAPETRERRPAGGTVAKPK